MRCAICGCSCVPVFSFLLLSAFHFGFLASFVQNTIVHDKIVFEYNRIWANELKSNVHEYAYDIQKYILNGTCDTNGNVVVMRMKMFFEQNEWARRVEKKTISNKIKNKWIRGKQVVSAYGKLVLPILHVRDAIHIWWWQMTI